MFITGNRLVLMLAQKVEIEQDAMMFNCACTVATKSPSCRRLNTVDLMPTLSRGTLKMQYRKKQERNLKDQTAIPEDV